MKLRHALLATAGSALFLAPAAAAHVEISPAKVRAGSVARFTIEVPTERKGPTVELRVKLAPGLTDVTLVPKTGWKGTNRRGIITWSSGKIAPGQSSRFLFTAHVPTTGKVLNFPAIQVYAKGPVVRWIGAPGSDTPAPRVTLEGTVTKPVATPSRKHRSGGHRGIAIAIGVVIVGGLLALGVVLLRKRRA